jgi:hypothetical protein
VLNLQIGLGGTVKDILSTLVAIVSSADDPTNTAAIDIIKLNTFTLIFGVVGLGSDI